MTNPYTDWIKIEELEKFIAPEDSTSQIDLWFDGDGEITGRITGVTRHGRCGGFEREEWSGGRNTRHTITKVFLKKPTFFMLSPMPPKKGT